MMYNEVLERLIGPSGTRQRIDKGKGVAVFCPVHETTGDHKRPSLHVTEGSGGRTLVDCKAGCPTEDVMAAVGLSMADLFDHPMSERNRVERVDSIMPMALSQQKSPPGMVVAKYRYRDPQTNAMCYEILRLEYPDGSKQFRFRRPDGHGGWLYRVDDTPLLLYRSPELAASDPSTTTVYLCEGEGNADAVMGLGLLAVSAPFGAGKFGMGKGRYEEQLRGRPVVVLQDNDDPGAGDVETKAASLYGKAASVKTLLLPDLPDKGDVVDWITAGGTREALVALTTATPEWAPDRVGETVFTVSAILPDTSNGVLAERNLPALTSLEFLTAKQIAEETPDEIRWVAKPWIAAGAITEVSGKVKSAGKTTFLLGIARRILDGEDFMGNSTLAGPVVYLTEQPASSFRVALGRADLLDREDFVALFWHRTAGRSWSDVVAQAAEECRRRGAVVLIVDTLPQFAGVVGESENDAGAALEAMRPLQIAAGSGLAVVVVRHDRKSGGEVGDSGRGSSAYSGAVDIVLSIRRLEGQGRETAREIHALTRFDETPARLVIDLRPDGQYVALGTIETVARQEARDKILAALPTDEADALSVNDLSKEAGISRTLGQDILATLEREGLARHIGRGKRGDPLRFLSARTESLGSGRMAEINGHGNKATSEDLVADAERRFGGRAVEVRFLSPDLRTDAGSGH